MAGRKLPVLPTNSTPADEDLMYNVDVSDTSESAQGTSKQNTFLQAYTYVVGKLATALRLIPSGGTTGQALTKASNTDYDVEWTNPGTGTGAVDADAPILGDGTSGDHLRLDFDSTPTDASSKMVNSNAVYDFSMTVVNITNAALNTLCSGGTVNAKAMYRVTDAAQGVVRVWGKSSTQVSCAAFLEGSADGSTYLEGEWGNYDLSVDLFAGQYPSGKLTITPVITSANGSCGDMDIMWTKQGNVITAHLFARDFVIDDTTTATTFTIDLASTAIAPTSNFTGGFQLTGNVSVIDVNISSGIVEASTINTVSSSKKLQIAVGLTAASSGDYTTAIGGSICFEIVPS